MWVFRLCRSFARDRPHPAIHAGSGIGYSRHGAPLSTRRPPPGHPRLRCQSPTAHRASVAYRDSADNCADGAVRRPSGRRTAPPRSPPMLMPPFEPPSLKRITKCSRAPPRLPKSSRSTIWRAASSIPRSTSAPRLPASTASTLALRLVKIGDLERSRNNFTEADSTVSRIKPGRNGLTYSFRQP